MNLITRAGFWIAIGGGVLAASPATVEIYVLAKIALLAAGGALIWAGQTRRAPARTALDGPLAGLLVAMAASTAASIDVPISVFGIYPQAFYGLAPLGLCAALYYGAATASDEPEARHEIVTVILAAAAALGAYAVWQGLFGDTLTGHPLPDGRVTSTIGNPAMLGACLVPLCPLALHETLRRRSPLAAASLVLTLAALALTWSRGAWLSASAGAALYLFCVGRLRLSRRAAWSLLFAAPLVFLALQRGLGKRDSDALRLETSKAALAAFEARPLLGSGPDTFWIQFRRYKTEEFVRLSKLTTIGQYSAHDDVLQVAATLGILGLLAYGWLVWALGARLFFLLRGPKPDGLAAAVAGAMAALFLQAKFNPIPLSALILAAPLAGLVCRLRPAAAGRAAPAAAAAFCAICAVLFARFHAADGHYYYGVGAVGSKPVGSPSYAAGVAELRRAAALNPWQLDYLAKRVDVDFNSSQSVPPEEGKRLIDEALDLTTQALRLHPANPTSHEMRATALALSGRFGPKRLLEAQAEIKTASMMDPTFAFTLRRRMDIDRALGDDADFQAARIQYLRVIQLTHESPAWQSPNF
jgi:O-antigen ligase